MKIFAASLAVLMLVLTQVPAYANPDDRDDRRDERGRSDERDDKQDCRQEEGAVGKDKRDCKQEEARDGVKGNQGERVGNDD